MVNPRDRSAAGPDTTYDVDHRTIGAHYLAPLKHQETMPQDERARNHAKRRAAKRLAAHKAAAEGKPATEASKNRKGKSTK